MDVIIIIWGYTDDSKLYQFYLLYMTWSRSPQFTDVKFESQTPGPVTHHSQ